MNAVRRPASPARLVLLVAMTALLLVTLLAGLAALGTSFYDELGAEYGWVAFCEVGRSR